MKMRFVNKPIPLIVLALLGMLLFSCNTNEDPVCTITNPADNALIEKGTVVNISVTAEDTDGNIAEVRYYINDIGIGSVTAFPYNLEWNTATLELGNYRIHVEAVDDAGGIAEDEIGVDIYAEGFFLDSRDDHVYRTVEINGKIWLGENLQYDDGEYGVYQYNNDAQIAEEYGLLYRWENAGEACPEGWHLPAKSEWEQLIAFAGGVELAGNNLKEADTLHWFPPNENVTDLYGFTALPGGYEYLTEYQQLRNEGIFWSSTYNEKEGAFALFIYADSSSVNIHSTSEFKGFSVRCIKD